MNSTNAARGHGSKEVTVPSKMDSAPTKQAEPEPGSPPNDTEKETSLGASEPLPSGKDQGETAEKEASPGASEPPPTGKDQEAAGWFATLWDTIVEWLCCIVVVGAAGFLTVISIAIYLSSQRNATEQALYAAPELWTPCGGRDAEAQCRNLSLYMLDAVNPDAAPCMNFYESVCGRWRVWDRERRPYSAEHGTLFRRRVSDQLVNMATRFSANSSESPGNLENQMALFHVSCIKTTGDRSRAGSVMAVLKAIGTHTRQWTNAPSFGALVQLAVSTSLGSGLASFVRVIYSRERKIGVTLGETLASTFQRDSDAAMEFVIDAFEGLDVDSAVAKSNFTTLFALDHFIENIRIVAESRNWSTLKSYGELTSAAPDVNWKDALEQGLPPTLKNTEPSPGLEIKGVEVITRIIDHLRQKSIQLAGVYSLFLLLSQVMKHAPRRGQGTDAPPSATLELRCLNMTALHFYRLYPLWVARTFQSQEQMALARAVFNDIVSTLKKDPKVNNGLSIDTRRIEKARLVFYGETRNESLPTTPLDVALGPAFLPNLAAVTAANVGDGPVSSDEWLPQVTGLLGYRNDEHFVISTAYVSGTGIFADFSRDGTLRTYIAYATLGSAILRAIFDRDVAFFVPWQQEYIKKCFVNSSSAVLGRPVDDRLAMAVMRFRWSWQLSWLLKTLRVAGTRAERLRGGTEATADKSWHAEGDLKADVPTVKDESSYMGQMTFLNYEKLFFRVLCFTQCGEANSAELCDDAAGFDRRFAEAFQCPARTLNRLGRCECIRMNHCQTHLPPPEHSAFDADSQV
ncbi:uncharacterized protein LOC144139370 [Haemaphysalis longicornis]